MEDDDLSNAAPQQLFQPRRYQQELLDDSLHRNLIIALDTGSGKTHIAVLRMKLEAERNPFKISWFLAPTVALIEQQKDVIAAAIPVSVGLISGASEPDQWKDAEMWRRLLDSHRIMVSTPQILLDALNHGYLHLSQVGLLIFDEAHHATAKHPYNLIMSHFYSALPPRIGNDSINAMVRPMILGLTASPIYGGDVSRAFRELERNLDSVVRSSRRNREELSTYVHRPVFQFVEYCLPSYQPDEISWEGPSRNVVALQAVVGRLNIENDPYVKSLRGQLAKSPPGDQRTRIDQKLSKVLSKKDTFTHKGLRDFVRTACDICYDLGPWAADWFVATVIEIARSSSDVYNNIVSSWQEREKHYLLALLGNVQLVEVSREPADILQDLSARVRKLVEVLKQEDDLTKSHDEPYSGIVFVTRRDSVLVLGAIISRLSDTSERFRIGCLLGSSSSFKRHSFLDITRALLKESATDVLQDFRNGDKNLIISTAVAEEGIDIQACGSVIRFDPPSNMVAWAQSRGRARRKASRFVIMFDNLNGHAKVEEWERMEKEMMNLYNSSKERIPSRDEDDLDENSPLKFCVESTGALLTLNSVMGHLSHFCAVLPSSGHQQYQAYFALDPPDFPDEWHAQQISLVPSKGPWRATCVLPRILPLHLRKFTTDFSYPSKLSAQKHAAFEAYVSLYEAGLLNDNLLPFTSVIEDDAHEEVKLLLEEVESRAGVENVPVQMDPWYMPGQTKWFCSELAVEALPPLLILTRQSLPIIMEDDLPALYIPGRAPARVQLRPQHHTRVTDTMVAEAEVYTARLFTPLYGARMAANQTDFVHLFLPTKPGAAEPEWDCRRAWMMIRHQRAEHVRPETKDRANAATLGHQFGYPSDLSVVRANDKTSKALRFVGWHDGPISDDEAEELRARYEDAEMDIPYPLLVVRELPRRANFLIPLANEFAGLGHEEPFLLVPSESTVDLLSCEDLEYSLYLPSILRGLSKVITVASLRDSIFISSPLYHIPSDLLMVALIAPVSQEPNYQRLETLGDTVLKFTIGIQLFTDHPWWHEGYLSRRKDHAVNNSRLAKDAIGKELYKWIIRDRYVARKWRPRYLSDQAQTPPVPKPEDQALGQLVKDEDGKEPTPKELRAERRRKNNQQLSTKVMADVVESLMGAAYEHGGFDLAIDCARLFGLGIPLWQPISARIETILARVEEVEGLPAQLAIVERMLGYSFTRKMLLVEALTHATYHGDLENVSYERLEFLGDAALDMVVTHFLYHAPGKNYSPGHMHLRKEALVNAHILAFLCVDTSLVLDASMPSWTPADGLKENTDEQRVHLYQCLLHSSHIVMDEQLQTFRKYQKKREQIWRELRRGTYYPWAALSNLQAPKFISDLFESLLGAVLLDSEGNLDAVRDVLKTLGWFSIAERIVDDDVDVLHPISRLAIWAAKQEPKKKLEVSVERERGNIVCKILVDEEEVSKVSERYRGKTTRNGVRFAAADAAIRKLHVIEEQTPDDVDDVGWPDEVPQYAW